MTNPLLPLTTRKLCYQIGATAILTNINLTVSHPGITAIVGPNGAGKSILLRLLHGLLDASSGNTFWHGQAMTSAHHMLRKQQAMVFQQPVLLRRSVKANIDFVLPPKERSRSLDILAAAGLSELAQTNARSLSGGEQQRLAMARAIATQPQVLMLDEVTANLDPRSTAEIEQQILHISQQGCKVFFISHDQGQLRRLADEVIFIHNGHCCEHTPADDFLRQPQSAEARAYLAGKLLIY